MKKEHSNVIHLNNQNKKVTKEHSVVFSDSEGSEDFVENSYKSCFTCLHYKKSAGGSGKCGHFPQANFHEVTVITCTHNNGKLLWYPKKTIWQKVKEVFFKT